MINSAYAAPELERFMPTHHFHVLINISIAIIVLAIDDLLINCHITIVVNAISWNSVCLLTL